MSAYHLNFYSLSPKFLEEFLQTNNWSAQQIDDLTDDQLRDEANRLFGSPYVQYTFPIVDLYISSNLDRNAIPQIYTPTQVVNMTNGEKLIFSQVLKVPIDDMFNIRVIRILDLLGKIDGKNDYDLQMINQARGSNNMIDGDIDLSPLINSGNHKQIKQIFRDNPDDYQELFEQIIRSGNVDILRQMKVNFQEEYDYIDLYIMFQVAIESGNPKMMKLILSDLGVERMDEDEYLRVIADVVEKGNVDLLKQIDDDIYPNLDIYLAAVRSNSVPMLTYIQSRPMIKPNEDELEWEEDEILELQNEVSPINLIKYAGQFGADQIVNYLIQQASGQGENPMNPALLGEIERANIRDVPILDNIKRLVHQGATNLLEALMKTQHPILFNWLLDQINLQNEGWNSNQLNEILVKSVSLGDPELVEKTAQLGANNFRQGLSMALRENTYLTIPILRELGQVSDQEYVNILNEELIGKVRASSTEDISNLVDLGRQIGVELELNSALIEAAKMGRLGIMEKLIQLGATNLVQAYQMADTEKQGWIQRKFAGQIQ